MYVIDNEKELNLIDIRNQFLWDSLFQHEMCINVHCLIHMKKVTKVQVRVRGGVGVSSFSGNFICVN